MPERPPDPTRSEVPSGGAYVIEQPRGSLSRRLRALAKRIPGAARLHDGAFHLGREINALLYSMWEAITTRIGHQPAERLDRQLAPRLPLSSRSFSEGLTRLDPSLVSEDGDIWWIAPSAELRELLSPLCWTYPPDTGCRLLLRPGGAANVQAIALAGNVLHIRGIGPRLLDVIHDTDGDRAAFLVQDPGVPTDAGGEADAILAQIQDLLDAKLLVSRAPWRDARQVRQRNGQCGYAAFERFAVDEPERVQRDVLDQAARGDLHFGRELSTRGGRYLYQSVPAVSAFGRRDSARRWHLIRDMLVDAGVDVSDRVVLDIGCNAGMMLAGALSDGARWGLGWDLPSVVSHARALLLTLGFTRFDLTAATLSRDYRLAADVPPSLHQDLDEAIVLYLAIRHHVGFLSDLARMPWKALVYEGGETEQAATIDRSLAELRSLCAFETATVRNYRGGETRLRPIAVLLRR